MSGIKGIVYGKGINDMEHGWTKANEWNKRVYRTWHRMFVRCYSSKYHEKQPTYIGCTVCNRWLRLSNFVEDIVKIPNYEYWLNNPNKRVALDKDIKSNGQNKCYCLEQCQFVSQTDNNKQAMSTRNYDDIKGENNPMYGKHPSKETRQKQSEARKGKHHSEETRAKISESNRGELVAQIDKNTNRILNLKHNREYIELGFNNGAISACCKKRLKTHKGFIWKYISDVSEEQLNEYYESH